MPEGRIADGFRWAEPNDDRDPALLLAADGVRLDGRRLTLRSDELTDLLGDD